MHAPDHHLSKLPSGRVVLAIAADKSSLLLLQGPEVEDALYAVGGALDHIAELVAGTVDLLASELDDDGRVLPQASSDPRAQHRCGPALWHRSPDPAHVLMINTYKTLKMCRMRTLLPSNHLEI